MKKMLNILESAKKAQSVLPYVSTKNKNKALVRMAKSLEENMHYILLKNAKDTSLAKKNKLKTSYIDRLALTKKRVKEMADGIRAVSHLKDPLNRCIGMRKISNGLIIKKVSVPIGVIGIIYESRPNVTSDCASLCLKSGNVCILRGGKESINSNIAIHKVITKDLEKFGIPSSSISMVNFIDRKGVEFLLKSDNLIDLIIPRGGKSLIKYVSSNSRIPVIKHYKGVCNLYIDKYADLNKGVSIAYNAKVQRPGVCNAIENLIVHKDVAKKFLPLIKEKLVSAGVEMRGCSETQKILKGIKKAQEKDWYEEYLDLILSIKIVKDSNEAIEFINKYGSSHSDAIVTKNKKTGNEFLSKIDSACVYLNASTRFTDGYQFGLGAEIGISTDKIHARGPMALEELCTYKYVILGKGQTRE